MIINIIENTFSVPSGPLNAPSSKEHFYLYLCLKYNKINRLIHNYKLFIIKIYNHYFNIFV